VVLLQLQRLQNKDRNPSQIQGFEQQIKANALRQSIRDFDDRDANASAQRTFLTTKEAAAYLRLSEVTMCRRRIAGDGPPYRKFGHCVRYNVVDLDAWAQAQTRVSTSQPVNNCPTSLRSE
jgi:Helix-turn-helix domain